MAAGKGRLVKLEVNTGGGSPATYVEVGGVQAKTITIANEQVDITSDDTAPFRQLLADAGMRSASISGNGVNKDDAQINAIRALALNGNLEDFRITLPSSDTVEGLFQVASYEESGEYNGANLFSITLESGGTITLTEA